MEELEKIINEINISQDNNVFNFDPLCNELDTIEYHTITENKLIENFINWYDNNKKHSFPRKKKKWINMLTSYRNLRKVQITYNKKIIAQWLKNTRRIPCYMKKNIHEFKEKIFLLKNKSIGQGKAICEDKLNELIDNICIERTFTGTEFYNILISKNLLSQDKYKIYINPCKKNKNKRILEDDMEVVNNTINLKKIKF